MKTTDLKPVINSKLDCVESVFATLAFWAERDHGMLFAETWGFRYTSNQKNSRIGQCIHSDIPHDKRFFESSTGIKVRMSNYPSGEEALDYILEETGKGRPVIVGIDSYWCPWSKLYLKHSLLHYFFVTDYNRLNETLLCIDPFFAQTNIALPLDCYKNGYTRILRYTFQEETEQHSLYEIISETIHRLTGGDRSSTAFQDMISLAHDIENAEDLKKDVEGYPVLGASPLIFNSVDVAKGRFKFADFLRYASDHYKVGELTGVAEELKSLGSGWMLISSLIAKCILQKKAGDIKSRITEKILRIAEQEQSVCEALNTLNIEIDRSNVDDWSNKP